MPSLPFSDQREFHGIVFSRTRQGAHYLAEVLRAASGTRGRYGAATAGVDEDLMDGDGQSEAAPLLGFIQAVYVFVGHGEGSKGGGEGWLASGSSRAEDSGLKTKGMSSSKQQAVLELFKVGGG